MNQSFDLYNTNIWNLLRQNVIKEKAKREGQSERKSKAWDEISNGFDENGGDVDVEEQLQEGRRTKQQTPERIDELSERKQQSHARSEAFEIEDLNDEFDVKTPSEKMRKEINDKSVLKQMKTPLLSSENSEFQLVRKQLEFTTPKPKEVKKVTFVEQQQQQQQQQQQRINRVKKPEIVQQNTDITDPNNRERNPVKTEPNERERIITQERETLQRESLEFQERMNIERIKHERLMAETNKNLDLKRIAREKQEFEEKLKQSAEEHQKIMKETNVEHLIKSPPRDLKELERKFVESFRKPSSPNK